MNAADNSINQISNFCFVEVISIECIINIVASRGTGGDYFYRRETGSGLHQYVGYGQLHFSSFDGLNLLESSIVNSEFD